MKQYQSPYVKKWLGDLKHEVYEADQLLDEIATYAQRKSKVRGFFSAFTNPFGSRIRELLEKLDFLAKQKDMLGLKGGTTCASHEGGVSWKPSERFPTTSLVDESSIYGREGDKEEVINFLLSDNVGGGNQVPIISIVGLGGIGKTTLAQLAYNDHRMQGQFELKSWVYVSESFDVVGLTKAILKSFRFSADGEDLNLLQHQLQQRLEGKKYLLVLDDVWNGNGECWERLLLPFNQGSFGSKIMVTTRDKEVASVIKSTKLLHLKQLEETDCWSLFVRRAFHGRNVSNYPNLESTGKEIVDKCGGLPLAVKALGNLLRRNFCLCEHAEILETDLWGLSENDNNINPAFRLSYHNLHSDLKRCFAFCSIFPKGYKFGKGELIKLWMADGLLKSCRTGKSEEELGNEFFNDLVSISFFRQVETLGDDKYFVMHDLVNDLAKSVLGEFCLQIEGDRMQGIPKRTRHLRCSLNLKDGEKIFKHICKIKGLRSLMVQKQCSDDPCLKICNHVQHDLFSRLKYLRMLTFSGCILSDLAVEIGNLKLLRYLDLSCTRITRLPDSICTLHNLETLILKYCFLAELPLDFYKLHNLHHLDLKCTSLKKMPKHIGRLIHLQTLTHFFVGEHNGSSVKELSKLDHLQGTLHIRRLENVIDPADAAKAHLKHKKHLERLYIMYGDKSANNGSIIVRDVLEALQPNCNLNRLTIKGYPGPSFPNWLGDCHCLPNLVSLKLRDYVFCSQLPPLGQLPSLKKLSIGWSHGIEVIGAEFYGNNSLNVPFRSLEILEFGKMPDWKEWLCPEGFPLLKELSIRECPKLKRALPQHLPSLQKLEISNCEELEASIPKAANISELHLEGCENILLNEFPSSLKKAFLHGTRVIHSSLQQILFNNAFLEELDVRGFHGPNLECYYLDLHCCDSLRSLLITSWFSSSLPFAPSWFTNLNSLYLFDCPELESFPGAGLPSNLSSLKIFHCPKLFASRGEWGLFKLHSLKEFSVCDNDFENVESFPEESLLPPNINSLGFEYSTNFAKR